MKKLERMHNKMENLLDSLGIPKEPPKGSFYDLSSDEDPGSDEEPKLKSGGQPRNQNARKHGFYSKHLSSKRLKEFQSVLNIKDLSPEIALLRFTIIELLDSPDVSQELVLKTLNSLGKLVNIQNRYYV